MKDYKAATLVGTRTFGKGIVQSIVPFGDGTAMKVTVSKYYTPNGVNIHGQALSLMLLLSLVKMRPKTESTIENMITSLIRLSMWL